MLILLSFACTTAEPNWDLLTPVAVECAPGDGAVVVENTYVDPFWEDMRRREACAEDPLNCDVDNVDIEPEVVAVEDDPDAAPVEPEVETELTPEVEPAAEVVAPAPETLPAPVGLATQAQWGIRLLKTLPTAQPPRAALGLADGTELVVSPGSMIPEAGIVVVSVGDGVAQVAVVEAAGDHAEIETLTLHAQY